MTTQVKSTSYLARNERWLRTLIISLVMISLHYMLSVSQIEAPPWVLLLPLIVGGVGMVLTGFFCFLTDTLSARLVQITIIGGTIALILAKIIL